MPLAEMINIFSPGSRVSCRGCNVAVTCAEGPAVRGQNVALLKEEKEKIQVDWRKNIYSEVTKIFTTPGELELVLASS